jgi:hypothetical protein
MDQYTGIYDDEDTDDLRAARDMVNRCILSAIIWNSIIFLIWYFLT